ncbi:MAG: ferric iron uptake transcriptional regulator [Porticoccaceae bacterium]
MSDEDLEIRKAGLKVTHPRVKILQVLEESEQKHMTADDVYRGLTEAGEDVGIATVYRVLTQFETAGLIEKNIFDDGAARYEINRGAHHDHMVCMVTGRVMEFHNEDIEDMQTKAAEEAGYELVGHSLVLYVRPLSTEQD